MSYQQWIERVEPSTFSPVVVQGYRPLISIVVPAYNTPDKYLTPLLDSVIAQTYDNWELVLVQASPDPERAASIREASRRDQRIKLVEVDGNKGIAGNTNIGIEAAKGEFIAFLDHDDTLASVALNEVVTALQATLRSIGAIATRTSLAMMAMSAWPTSLSLAGPLICSCR